MKILVTGATGFIGKYVINTLLSHSHTVFATSSNKNKAKECEWLSKVFYFPYKIGYPPNELVYKAIKESDICIHLAWQGLPDYKNPLHEQQFLTDQINFCTLLLKHGIKKITVTGTCLEYGLIEGELIEGMLTNPITSYGKGKDILRRHLEMLKKDYHFELDWIRLFYIYGNGKNQKSLLSQLDAAIDRGDKVFNMSKGDQLRDYLPVEKVAEIIVYLALREKGAGIVNCCSGEPITISELVEKRIIERKASIILNKGFYDYPDYEPFAFWGSNKKLKMILNEKNTTNV